jgi:hypothetical protein
MKNKFLIFATVVLVAFSNEGRSQIYKDFKFSEELNYDLSDSLLQEGEIVLESFFSKEYVVEAGSESCYTFSRSVKMVNSDEAITNNNKIYLQTGENTEYLYQLARVVKPNGDKKVLKESDVLEGTFEGDDGVERKYLYYAIEGLERGSIIEVVSYKRRFPDYTGTIHFLQSENLILDLTFELIAPSHLGFAFKTFNHNEEVVYDTTQTDFNRWVLALDTVPALEAQSYMFPNVVKKALVYKLDRNFAQNKSDITNYGSLNQYFINRINPEFTKKQEKAMMKIADEIGLEGLSEFDKILAIEDYFKTNYNILDNSNQQLENIDFILANQAANEFGIALIMNKLFKTYDIGVELVLTSDRSEYRFDPEFEAYCYLNEILLYFPKHKLFIAPSERYLRGKYIPETWSSTYGLFIREVKLGEMSTAVGEIKYIEPLPYSANENLMDINVDFSEDIANPDISFKISQQGYAAQYIQPLLHLFDDEQLTEFQEEIGGMISDEVKAQDVTIENTGVNDFGKKPLIFQFTSDDHGFVKESGTDYLFNIGGLIGEQVELYKEEDRKYPIEKINRNYYLRTITFKIPEGYEVANLDALNLKRTHEDEGKPTMLFESRYDIEGDQVTVIVEEFYDRIFYPVEWYDPFAKVVNAAADFNKITLVLKPKV